jgi:mannose-6-phosphate isomerase-like protein (cupin superfamily)
MLDKVPEAPLRAADAGLAPEGDGWFIVNVAEARGLEFDRFGPAALFEGASRFPEFGINVQVLQPGEPSGLYHRENAQEAFLVLSGECIAIVEDEERPMRKGDFLHSPAGCNHIIVGAGDGPSAVLMAGTRKGDDEEIV